MRFFSEDHGINGDEMARDYGYDSLQHFLRSPEMAPKIIVEAGPNGVLYKGIPNETNAHLREATRPRRKVKPHRTRSTFRGDIANY